MMSGCGLGPNAADAPAWTSPLVVSYAQLACPDVDPSAEREFKRRTAAPAPDTVDEDGKPAVSRGNVQKKIDELLASEMRKNAAGRRVIADHKRCTGGGEQAKSPSTSPNKALSKSWPMS